MTPEEAARSVMDRVGCVTPWEAMRQVLDLLGRESKDDYRAILTVIRGQRKAALVEAAMDMARDIRFDRVLTVRVLGEDAADEVLAEVIPWLMDRAETEIE